MANIAATITVFVAFCIIAIAIYGKEYITSSTTTSSSSTTTTPTTTAKSSS
jgi:hypothetical protein